MRFRTFFTSLIFAIVTLAGANPFWEIDSIPEKEKVEKILIKNPESAKAWFYLGYYGLKEGDDQLASSYFTQSQELSNHSDTARISTGIAWLYYQIPDSSLKLLLPYRNKLPAKILLKLQESLKLPMFQSLRLTLLQEVYKKDPSLANAIKAARLAHKLSKHFVVHKLLLVHSAELSKEDAFIWLESAYLQLIEIDVESLNKRVLKDASGDLAALISLHRLKEKGNEAIEFIKNPQKSETAWQLLFKAKYEIHTDQANSIATHLKKAMEIAQKDLKPMIFAELYQEYSLTGSRWELEKLSRKLKNPSPAPEFFQMGIQLEIRGYEKQARQIYSMLNNPPQVHHEVVAKIFNHGLGDYSRDMLMRISEFLRARYPLDCDAQIVIMKIMEELELDDEVMNLALKCNSICYEKEIPYLITARTMYRNKKYAEAREMFSLYKDSGGDINNIPPEMKF